MLGERLWECAIAAGDPYWSSVTSLFHFDNNATDSSTTGLVLTNSGVTFSNSIYKFGGYSAYFNGSALLSVSTATAATKFAGDFTVEMWVYPTFTFGGSNIMLFTTDISGNHNIMGLGYQGSNGWDAFAYISNAGSGKNAPNTMTTNNWYHLAFVRASNVVTVYQNGSPLITGYNLSGNISDGGFKLGGDSGWGSWSGYVDELRITNGVARYTSSFTPQTAAFPNHG